MSKQKHLKVEKPSPKKYEDGNNDCPDVFGLPHSVRPKDVKEDHKRLKEALASVLFNHNRFSQALAHLKTLMEDEPPEYVPH